jgi:hypothetical protein
MKNDKTTTASSSTDRTVDLGSLGPPRQVGNGGPRFPFGDRLRVDPVELGQSSQALSTMLYGSTNRLCRRGAPM